MAALLVELFDRLPAYRPGDDEDLWAAGVQDAMRAFRAAVREHYTEGTLQRVLATSADPKARRAAALAIGLTGTFGAVPGVAAALHDDDQLVRATLGRLLFSGDEIRKSTRVLSGGEKGRMIYGKLMLSRSNVLLMDEPTNHMDMETIESLQIALEKYAGTLIFVSHDREFVGALATRILELRPDGSFTDYRGTYDEYLKSQGIEVM